MAKTIYHKAESRGDAMHGWLHSRHTFSFANYYNPERMHFGALRVLNDDIVSRGEGFGMHPHDNMEIISIPLQGDLEHKDNLGNIAVIRKGDIQVMSAGTGIFHSEYNHNKDTDVNFLQIWVLTNKKNASPRYDQKSIRDMEKENTFFQILSPNADDQGVWIYQDAWFHLGYFKAAHTESYHFKKEGNGLYIFLLEGQIEVDGQILDKRDGYGIWDTDKVTVTATKDASILLMEVPMNF
ncbi:MAG: pirin family protein [Bacteroidetes bacterium]|nr:pirin family protein [Bacteroidota bacterium]